MRKSTGASAVPKMNTGSVFGVEIMLKSRHIPSSNNTGSDTEFILRGRSFIYIMNNRGPTIDPWGTPCCSVPQPENKF